MYQVPPQHGPNTGYNYPIPTPLFAILQQAIKLLRRFPGVFVALAAIQVLPALAFNIYADVSGVNSRAIDQLRDLLAEVSRRTTRSNGDPQSLQGFPWSYPVNDIRSLLIISLISLLISSFLFNTIAKAGIVVAVGDAHTSEPTFGAALKAALTRLPQLLSWALLSFIGTVGLFVLLLIPCLGIILVLAVLLTLWIRLTFVTQIIIAEQVSVFEAIRRSWLLTRGAIGRIFAGLLLFVVVVSVVIGVAVLLINSTVGALFGANSLGIAFIQTINMLGQLATLPITLISVTMLYYDERRLRSFAPQPPPTTLYPPYQ